VNPESNKGEDSIQFDLIAERVLTGSTGQQTFEVKVRLGKPVPDPKGDWMCPFQIIGTGDGRAEKIFGIDAVQALQLAMFAAGAKLDRIRENVALIFLNSDDLGFPGSSKEATGSCPYCRAGDSKC
jgi:hypothetical protein